MKKLATKALYVIGYLAVFLPILFSVYYSVPASDDFAAATRRNGKSLISQSAFHGFGMWKSWGGRWLTQFFQTFVNPLNSHEHLGHKYGIYMIVIVIITTIAIAYGITVILERVLGKDCKYISLVRFLTIVVLFITNYYSECYNWFVGAMVFTIPFAFIFIAIASMIKYTESEESSWVHYWIMILAGIFPTTIEYCDPPMGFLYLYFIYICRWQVRKNEPIKEKVKNVVPLLVYIAFGISNVFAPGNAIRQAYYHLDLSITGAFKQFVIDLVLRVQDLIVDKPFSILILVVIFFIGVISNREQKKEERVLLAGIFFIILTTSSLYPYIYGRGFINNSYLDIRMEYVLDYCIEMGFSIMAIKIGRLVAEKMELEFTKKELFGYVTGFILISYVALIPNYAYLNIMQIDLLRSKSLIIESYNYWDGIITEIENSSEDDVVIYRDSEPQWSRYFFPLGLTNGDKYAVPYDKVYDEEYIMPNVYYEKNSITLFIE